MPDQTAGGAPHLRIDIDIRDLPRIQRLARRLANDRRSSQVIAGMVLLLAVCGFAIGGEEGATRIVAEATGQLHDVEITPRIMRERFGATPLTPRDWPGLFAMLSDICRRAGLPRLPDLYCIADSSGMNAYALGGPESSAITLTAGLLRGMSPHEVAGILAHEVAHICSDDARAMALAAAFQRAIAAASSLGLMRLSDHRAGPTPSPLLALLLSAASAIGQLLYLGLSRLQEADADALAVELIGDPNMLVNALHKLERHHFGHLPVPLAPQPHANIRRLLRSHPATAERVGRLLGFAAA
jgi:heat shock protein HtpX